MREHGVTKPWMCQLVHVDEIDGGLWLDLIALDACPFPTIVVRRGMPFVIRVVEHRALHCVELVRAWADDGVVVAIHLVNSRPGRWLCVSDGDQQLLLEMTASETTNGRGT